jgi:AcrR family transcriptional regulator
MTTMEANVDPRIERTREVVVAATAALLVVAGFERITIEAIAEQSGVARSTIYRNWPDRADLFVEGFERLCAIESIPDLGSVEAELQAVGTMLTEGLENDEWGAALRSLIGSSAHDDELLAAQHRFSEQRRADVAEVFARGRARGEITSDAHDGDLVELFVAPFFFRHLMTPRRLNAELVERQVATLLRLVT